MLRSSQHEVDRLAESSRSISRSRGLNHRQKNPGFPCRCELWLATIWKGDSSSLVDGPRRTVVTRPPADTDEQSSVELLSTRIPHGRRTARMDQITGEFVPTRTGRFDHSTGCSGGSSVRIERTRSSDYWKAAPSWAVKLKLDSPPTGANFLFNRPPRHDRPDLECPPICNPDPVELTHRRDHTTILLLPRVGPQPRGSGRAVAQLG